MYNLYDNCPGAAAASALASVPDDISALELKRLLRKRLLPGGGGGGGGAAVEAVEATKAVHTEAARRQLGTTAAVDMTGGYEWSCGGMDATSAWITTPQVRAALHLRAAASGSAFSYRTSGPASITLWPTLAKRLRVLIYNGTAAAPPTAPPVAPRIAPPPHPLPREGTHCFSCAPPAIRAAGDADACVPYIGNEEWITSLETSGVLTEKDAWRPW